MHFFKFVFAFLSVGGATYAFIKLNETPPWLKMVSIMMGLAAIIIALPELPKAIDAVNESAKKFVAMLPSFPSAPIAQASSSTPTYAPPNTYEPPVPTYTPPKTYEAPQIPYTPPKCIALVMATAGGFGLSSGAHSCDDLLQRARNNCNSNAMGCGNYATGTDWVAGVHCLEYMGNRRRWNSFAGRGSTEDAAFEHALSLAANQGFGRGTCNRRVSMSSEMTVANRY